MLLEYKEKRVKKSTNQNNQKQTSMVYYNGILVAVFLLLFLGGHHVTASNFIRQNCVYDYHVWLKTESKLCE